MNFFQVAAIVNFLALFFIYVSPKYKRPLYGTPPYRLFGIFIIKHLIITVVSGSLIGWFSDIKPVWHAALYGTIFQFFFGQLLHIVFKVKTMLLYKLKLGAEPDGTGRLLTPIQKPQN
jgi:hypothetical protein